MTSETIVKIQRPLDRPKGPWLVYDQQRTVHRLIAGRDMPRAVVIDTGADFKIFYHAAIEGQTLTFIRRADHQDW